MSQSLRKLQQNPSSNKPLNTLKLNGSKSARGRPLSKYKPPVTSSEGKKDNELNDWVEPEKPSKQVLPRYMQPI